MPIYEYACWECHKQVSLFFRTITDAEQEKAACPICGGTNLHRLVSRIAVTKSEDRRAEEMADSALMAGLEQEDPQALASFIRQMSDGSDEPIDAEMDEMIGRMESGESLESIETSMPDEE